MDKTLNRDLENLTWRLQSCQCDILYKVFSELQQEYISQADIVRYCAKDLENVDKLLHQIELFLDPDLQYKECLYLLDTLEENLNLRDSLDKTTFLKNLKSLRRYYNSRIEIGNKPVKKV